MYRRMNQGAAFRLLKGVAPSVLAAVFGWSAVASAQTQAPASKTVPDAQVEANVLKALAAAPDLANQPLTTTTVYGVVTLSGSVETEAMLTEAETIASRTSGVQKVVDEMTLTGDAANAQPMQDSGAGGSAVQDAQGTNPNLQSDGTMAPQQGLGAWFGAVLSESRDPCASGAGPCCGAIVPSDCKFGFVPCASWTAEPPAPESCIGCAFAASAVNVISSTTFCTPLVRDAIVSASVRIASVSTEPLSVTTPYTVVVVSGWFARSGAAANAFNTFASTCASGTVLLAGACVWADATALQPNTAASTDGATPFNSRNAAPWFMRRYMPSSKCP